MKRCLLYPLFGGILICVSAAPANENASGQREYLPLSLGNEWVYTVYVSLRDSIIRNDVVRVDDLVILNGERYYHLNTPWFPIFALWVRSDDAGNLFWCETPGGVENPLLLPATTTGDGWLLGRGFCIDSVLRVDCNDTSVPPEHQVGEARCVLSIRRPGDCYDVRWSGGFVDGLGIVSWTMESVPGAYVRWRLTESNLNRGSKCRCHGDPVCDGRLDARDVTSAIGVAFRGMTPNREHGCSWFARQIRESSDVDCSGDTDVIDVKLLIDVVFRGESTADQFCAPEWSEDP